MKKEIIQELFQQFEEAAYLFEGVECWSARELQEIFKYAEWRNFQKVLEKAKKSCENAGEPVANHFVDVNKMVDIGSGTQRPIEDTALTRYACYLIAQNGDPSKAEIAFAQTYFAVQTRKQEIIEQRLLEVARVTARNKLTQSEKKLSGLIFERGVDEKSFAIIRSKGDEALFGGRTTQFMKNKLKVPDGRPLADFLPTLTIKAKDFATELTSHNVVEKELHGDKSITKEHIDNNLAVRRILIERGVKPEELPPAEDVKKVERRLAGDEKKMLKVVKKIQKRNNPSMNNYLTQLISDMHLAARRVPKSKIPEGTFDPDYQDELEASPEQPMSRWFGLDKEQFPPSDKLTIEQLELMASEFEHLWAVYSFEPDFPDGLPARRRYELMRDYLDHPCQHWPGGWVQHFEFCDYDTENCPFGTEFCKCKDFDDDPC